MNIVASAIIVAAGLSTRMGYVDKMFALVAGRSILHHTVETFVSSGLFKNVVVVVSAHRIKKASDVLSEFFPEDVKIIVGGKRRQDSVKNGLLNISKCGLVAIHDGARPCVTLDVLKKGIDIGAQTGAAIPGIPVTDTIKRVGKSGEVRETICRSQYMSIQTPQVFRYDVLKLAHERIEFDSPDDASMVERIGRKVTVFKGDPDNIKVTRVSDLDVVEATLISRFCK